jgi:hypothetical protein
MNWKTDLKLADLDAATRLEVTCKRCGLCRYEPREALLRQQELAQAYIRGGARLALFQPLLPGGGARCPDP